MLKRVAILVAVLGLLGGGVSAGSEQTCRSSWKLAKVPPEVGSSGDSSVDASSPTNAWMVGDAVARWNGTGWSKQAQPPRPSEFGFDDVVVQSANGVWVLGDDYVALWNGSQWKILAPFRLGDDEGLSAIAVSSRRDLSVFGITFEGDEGPVPGRAYGFWTRRWNGSRWEARRLLPLRYSGGGLYDADAVGTEQWVAGVDDCTASCYSALLGRRVAPGAWTSAAIPTRLPGCAANSARWPEIYARSAGLFDVNAVSPRDVWVAGFTGSCALVGHWNGRAWRVTRPTTAASRIVAIHAASPGEVWAIGDQWSDGLWSGPTVVLRFHSQRWRVVRTIPRVEFGDIVALQSGEMWAIGSMSLHHRCI